MSDLFATDDDAEIDEASTAAVAEILLKHGLLLPAYVAITTSGDIILRPIHERYDGHGRVLLN
jgi:hypothetical protein